MFFFVLPIFFTFSRLFSPRFPTFCFVLSTYLNFIDLFPFFRFFFRVADFRVDKIEIDIKVDKTETKSEIILFAKCSTSVTRAELSVCDNYSREKRDEQLPIIKCIIHVVIT